jgi:phage pi2 protein 07
MASFYKEGSKVQFEGYKGEVIKITETYRKNVLVVKITEFPRTRNSKQTSTLGLFEYPDGRLEFMSFID